MLKTFLPLLCSTLIAFTAIGQTNVDTSSQIVKPWKQTLSIGLNFNSVKLTNPPVGAGINTAGGNMSLHYHALYLNNEKRNFWTNDIRWNFGLLRLGSGPLEAGTSQKIPFQKTVDILDINSTFGHRFNDKFSVITGFDFKSQVTPSYSDPEGKVRGLFIRDIRSSNINPILSRFLSPGYLTAYVVGFGYAPSPKLFIGYSPATYKGILVLDDKVASLVGQVDANGLPTATIHGNEVEIRNGVPVFKNSLNQFGSYLIATYKEQFFKGKLSYSLNLKLFSNYLKQPEKVDMDWRNAISLNLFKGLNLTYMIDLQYDSDILVALTDDTVPGGFTGEFGQKLSIRRQFMLRYQINF